MAKTPSGLEIVDGDYTGPSTMTRDKAPVKKAIVAKLKPKPKLKPVATPAPTPATMPDYGGDGTGSSFDGMARGGMARANPMRAKRAAVSPTGPGKISSRMMGLKGGGSASKRADGIAQRGKTKGKVC